MDNARERLLEIVPPGPRYCSDNRQERIGTNRASSTGSRRPLRRYSAFVAPALAGC